jgi:hypothetical protein
VRFRSLSAQGAAGNFIASFVGALFLLLVIPIFVPVVVALLLRGASIFTMRCHFYDGRQIGLLEFSCPADSFGDFLWHTRLNQLPSVFNVLNGDVALDARLLTLIKNDRALRG